MEIGIRYKFSKHSAFECIMYFVIERLDWYEPLDETCSFGKEQKLSEVRMERKYRPDRFSFSSGIPFRKHLYVYRAEKNEAKLRKFFES